jgi:hypothetical protein
MPSSLPSSPASPASPAVAVVANAVVAVVAYDYDKLVSEILECRQLILNTELKMEKMKKGDDNVGVVGIVGNDLVIDLLTQSVNKFELLSGYCPMTPLLWMQYGSDAYKLMSYMTTSDNDDEVNEDDMGDVDDFVSGTSSEVIAIQTRLQILELGLHEFPGCAVLRLHYVEIMLVQSLLIIHNIVEAKYNEIATDEDLNTAEEQIIEMKQKYKHAVEDAISKIGLGSHRNESQVIVKLYQMRIDIEIRPVCFVEEQQPRDGSVSKTISTLFVKRAHVPMNDDINSSINDDYITTINSINPTLVSLSLPSLTKIKSDTLNEIEDGRRYESKYYGFLITYEDDIEISLQNESNVSLRAGMNQITTTDAADAAHAQQQQQQQQDGRDLKLKKEEMQYLINKWEPILNNNSSSNDSSSSNNFNCWMGLGGSQTAQTFINYAQSCFRFRSDKQLSNDSGPKEEEQDDEEKKKEKEAILVLQETIHDLAISVYERGIAECPTVDKLWISYLKRLMYLIEQTKTELEQQLDENGNDKEDNDEKEEQQQQQKLQQLLIDASNVVDRGIRNCPYSIELIQMKFTILLEKVNSKQMILDPEEIYTTFIKEQIFDLGFIGGGSGEVTQLFQLLITLIRKRILYVLADIANKRGYDPSDIMMKKNKNYKGKNKNKTPTRLHYDDSESIQGALLNNNNNNNNNNAVIDDDNNDNEEIQQELEDLCIDLREIYDEGDSYLRNSKDKIKNNKQQVEEGRALLAKDRVITETYLISPLLVTIQQQQQSEEESESDLESSSSASLLLLKERKEKVIELLKQYEKGTKVQFQPPHPNVFMSYIQALKAVNLSMSSCTLTNPIDIITNLRRIRFLYQKAITFVGKPVKKGPTNSRAAAAASDNNNNNVDELDYETSLRCLCHEYTIFEKYFGSNKSYSDCIKVTQKKLSKAFANQAVQEAAAAVQEAQAQAQAQTSIGIDAADDDVTTKATSQNKKRKLPEENRPNEGGGGINQKPPPVKKQKGGGGEKEETDHPMEVEAKTNSSLLSQQQQQQKHKIKIGKLEYPAHPYTVKVSCLHPNTEDMDLVNALRPKCGPIVHAKIMREKHNKTKSKGWGLVQFEERASVEKALQLSDSVDIKMKCVKIERSHIAAVSLVAVPPSNLDQNRNHNARGGSGTGSHHHQNRNHNARGGGGGGGLNKSNKNKHPKKEKDIGDGEGITETTTSNNKRSNNDLQQEQQKGGDGDVDMNKKPSSSSTTTTTKTTNVSKKSVLTFLPRGVGKK